MSPVDAKKFPRVLERKHKDLLSAPSNREETRTHIL
jgi:hypothetical protein